jgi:hypothetical protein
VRVDHLDQRNDHQRDKYERGESGKRCEDAGHHRNRNSPTFGFLPWIAISLRDERAKTRHRRYLDWPDRGEPGNAADTHDLAVRTQMRIGSVRLKRDHLVRAVLDVEMQS